MHNIYPNLHDGSISRAVNVTFDWQSDGVDIRDAVEILLQCELKIKQQSSDATFLSFLTSQDFALNMSHAWFSLESGEHKWRGLHIQQKSIRIKSLGIIP